MGQNKYLRDIMSRSVFINVDTIPLKIVCFLAGGFRSQISFLNVFFVSTGLSKFQAGIITGFTYAPPIVFGPVWGYLADYTGRRKLILTVLCVGAALPLISMPWIAKTIYPPSEYECGNTTITTITKNTTNSINGTFEFESSPLLNTSQR